MVLDNDYLFHESPSLGINGNAVKFQHSVKRRKFSYAFFVCKIELFGLRV